MPTAAIIKMFMVVDKHVVDGHLHVDAGALLLPRLAHNIFHWGKWVFIIFIFFHTTFFTGEVWFSLFSSFFHTTFSTGEVWFSLFSSFFSQYFPLWIGMFGFHFYLYHHYPVLVSKWFSNRQFEYQSLYLLHDKGCAICLNSFSLKNKLVSEFWQC